LVEFSISILLILAKWDSLLVTIPAYPQTRKLIFRIPVSFEKVHNRLNLTKDSKYQFMDLRVAGLRVTGGGSDDPAGEAKPTPKVAFQVRHAK
jgi:hypothetical protein